MTPPRLALTLALVSVAALAPATAHAASLTSDLRLLAHEAGGRGGFAVLDGRTGRTLAASGDRGVHPLGSTTKLITTATALDVLGRGATLTTTVLAAGAVDQGGTLTGDLILAGGGDPLLGEAGLATLADAVQAAGIATVTGSVVGEEALFDTLRGGPATSGAFDLNIGGALGALTYDRGRQVPGGPIQADPARAAAFRFDDVLEARGLKVRGGPKAAPTPPGATPLGVASTALPAVVDAINKPSDDFGAEMLAKTVGARAVGAGTTAAGAALISRRSGFTLADGSGVDEHSAGSARALARFVRAHRRDPVLAASLPVAGIDGTLKDRMRHGRARGRCRAKTGSLPQHRVSALAGWCADRGRTIVFAFLREGIDSESSAKGVEDQMVQRLLKRPASTPSGRARRS
jgi:D-alanyl-D-alanine carboxypeptidase/D-alanyl-D-alanine-endopeptidase (penicillin-binding protein 4)